MGEEEEEEVKLSTLISGYSASCTVFCSSIQLPQLLCLQQPEDHNVTVSSGS